MLEKQMCFLFFFPLIVLEVVTFKPDETTTALTRSRHQALEIHGLSCGWGLQLLHRKPGSNSVQIVKETSERER